MNVKKKVWYQIDTVGGSRRQKISAVLVLNIEKLWFPWAFKGISDMSRKETFTVYRHFDLAGRWFLRLYLAA